MAPLCLPVQVGSKPHVSVGAGAALWITLDWAACLFESFLILVATQGTLMKMFESSFYF